MDQSHLQYALVHCNLTDGERPFLDYHQARLFAFLFSFA